MEDQHEDAEDAPRDTSVLEFTTPTVSLFGINQAPILFTSNKDRLVTDPHSLVYPRPSQLSSFPCCNHGIIERRYCIDDDDVCVHCQRRPFFGWYYVCVEDSQEHWAPPLDPQVGPFFTPQAQSAIETGQYTDAQREKLMYQKLNVLMKAFVDRNTPSRPQHLRGLTPTTENCSTDDEVWVELIEDVNQDIQSSSRNDQSAVASPQSEDSLEYIPPIAPRPCNFTTCRSCEKRMRINLAERIYLSINELCNDQTINPPTAWDLRDRQISNVHIVRNLGGHQRNLEHRPPVEPSGPSRVGMSGINTGNLPGPNNNAGRKLNDLPISGMINVSLEQKEEAAIRLPSSHQSMNRNSAIDSTAG